MLGLQSSAWLGQRHGRDKVTVIASEGIADFGAWLEQLIAESTGKIGKRGIVPVDAEALGLPDGLRRRPRVRLYPARRGSGRGAGTGDRGARNRRPARWCASSSPTRSPPARPGILALGNCDGGGRLDSGNQSVRSAGCGGEQDQDVRPHRAPTRRAARCRPKRRSSATTRATNCSPTRATNARTLERQASPASLRYVHRRASGPADSRRLLRVAGLYRTRPERISLS